MAPLLSEVGYPTIMLAILEDEVIPLARVTVYQ